MADKKTTTGKTSIKSQITATVTSKVGNYEKHPFFVKKANAAKELIKKVGMPRQEVKRG